MRGLELKRGTTFCDKSTLYSTLLCILVLVIVPQYFYIMHFGLEDIRQKALIHVLHTHYLISEEPEHC